MSNAEQFICAVREKKEKSGITLSGPKSLSAGVSELILRETAKKSLTAKFNIRNLDHALKDTVEGFVELARRCQMPAPATLIPAITKCLLAELSQNCIAFNEVTKPGKLKALTIYHGANYIKALSAPEYLSLRDKPDILKYAALHHPTDPQKYLDGVLAPASSLEL